MIRQGVEIYALQVLMPNTLTSLCFPAHGCSMRAWKRVMRAVTMILINIFLEMRSHMEPPLPWNNQRTNIMATSIFHQAWCSIQIKPGLDFLQGISINLTKRWCTERASCRFYFRSIPAGPFL